MKYKIGDKLLIKSKIIPKEPYELYYDDSEIRVCTSCPNGWDRFKKADCDIQDGYVIHIVTVTDYDTYSDGHKTYHCKNDLSVTKCGWQGVADCDVIKRLYRGKTCKKHTKI